MTCLSTRTSDCSCSGVERFSSYGKHKSILAEAENLQRKPSQQLRSASRTHSFPSSVHDDSLQHEKSVYEQSRVRQQSE